MLIGAHLGKGTLDHDILETASEISQIFVSNPRGYQKPSLDALSYIKSPNPIYIHLPFLVNPASINAEVRAKSLELIIATDKIVDPRLQGIVIHGGQGGKESTVKQAIERWVDLFEGIKFNNKLLIENTAGGNAAPGKSINTHIELVQRLSKNNKIGICYDTCHSFASGTAGFLDDLECYKTDIGEVDLIHLNDSKDKHHSNRDRHELLGKGEIGLERIISLVKVAEKDNINIILETPGNNSIWNSEIKMIKKYLA
jgi:deoxyribonuclease-4